MSATSSIAVNVPINRVACASSNGRSPAATQERNFASIWSGASGFSRVLSSCDDFPIHQTSQPIARTGSSDLNHYDRYFFNGYTRDARLFFAAAMGLYPNRHVADAAVSVVIDGGTMILDGHVGINFNTNPMPVEFTAIGGSFTANYGGDIADFAAVSS